MSCQLSADCLNEVLEHLEGDKITLHSCLLVSRLWCEVSVRILWRNIWDFRYSVFHQRRFKVTSAILSTLVSCLPDESKNLLYVNEFFISPPTSKPPLFDYASFCKVLSINEIGQMIQMIYNVNSKITFISKDKIYSVTKEILKMFMSQISSLKSLTYFNCNWKDIPNNITFTSCPGARGCLTNLSELRCSLNLHSEFFYQLSQICRNLQSLTIDFDNDNVSNELKELISLQDNLKDLCLIAHDRFDWVDIIPALTKHSNTLTNLHLYSNISDLPLSFVTLFSNLQEIDIVFDHGLYRLESGFEDFNEVQYFTFPKLQILRIPYRYPKSDYLIKFLEINGKNLKEYYVGNEDSAVYLFIAKFCPNLKKLNIILNCDDLNILNTILNSCQDLESIEISCGNRYLSDKEAFEVVVNHSPKNLYELKIHHHSHSELVPEDLESFFISWKNREPKKSLSLVIIKECYISLEANEENMKIIEKYKNLGIVKKFKTKYYKEDKDV